MPKVIISRQTIDEIQRSSPVRSRLESKGARVLARARTLAFAEGMPEFARRLRLVTGTRPGTKSPTGIRRSFVQVVAPEGADEEYGNRGVTRQAILRRSIGA